ncbi:MAG: cytochrome c3 family protein [Eggerthellaceae bacterium]|nr:cytochrome c3 family protein [Eggerthellaceae bacterium]
MNENVTEEDISVAEENTNAAIKTKKRKKWAITLGVVLTVILAAGIGGWTWHEQPSFCSAICHDTMDHYVETWESSNYTVRAHAENGVTCLQCHEASIPDQINEAMKQISGDYVVPFAKMETDDAFCLRDGCHTREELESGTPIIDSKGNQSNPHSQTTNNDVRSPHGAGGSTISCSTCHTIHRKSTGTDYCYSCHHTETFESCYSCHGDAER